MLALLLSSPANATLAKSCQETKACPSVHPSLNGNFGNRTWNKVCTPQLHETIIGFCHLAVRMTFGQIRYLEMRHFIKQEQLILCTSIKLGRWPPDGSDVCIKSKEESHRRLLKAKKSSCCGCSTTVCSTGFN